jgi:hypothetical protein
MVLHRSTYVGVGQMKAPYVIATGLHVEALRAFIEAETGLDVSIWHNGKNFRVIGSRDAEVVIQVDGCPHLSAARRRFSSAFCMRWRRARRKNT